MRPYQHTMHSWMSDDELIRFTHSQPTTELEIELAQRLDRALDTEPVETVDEDDVPPPPKQSPWQPLRRT